MSKNEIPWRFVKSKKKYFYGNNLKKYPTVCYDNEKISF